MSNPENEVLKVIQKYSIPVGIHNAKIKDLEKKLAATQAKLADVNAKLEKEQWKTRASIRAFENICHECEISVHPGPDHIIWSFSKEALSKLRSQEDV